MPFLESRPVVLFHTVRHMRPDQIAWQLRYRLGLSFGVRTVPSPSSPARSPLPPVPRAREPLRVPPEKFPILSAGPAFTFLGETARFEHGVDWHAEARDKLWRYNLQYFDYLDELGRDGAAGDPAEFLHGWIRDNPIGSGEGWDPYPTSLRLVNWIRWAWLGGDADPVILESLAAQADWLSNHLERHVLANHYFTNGKALLCAGLYFDGNAVPAASAWLDRGLAIVGGELEEQILADGGHYELSAMYHGIVLDDVLDLLDMGSASKAVSTDTLERWRRVARSMLDWSDAMTHPDGEIPFFNDSMFGIVQPPAARRLRAGRLGLVAESSVPARVGSRHLEQSGYVRLVAGRAVLLADVGAVGPRYQPGHAHADTLSFELSIDDHRILVNGGTSTYEPGAERARVRSTAAHNTVEVDGKDSSEVWASFRVARRARPRDVAVDLEHGRLCAAHDGYRRLPGRVTHHRCWHLKSDALVVEDRLDGRWSSAIARYHLHPSLEVLDDGLIVRGDRVVARFRVAGGRAELTHTHWCPRFGEHLPNRCIAVHLDGNRARFELEFIDGDGAR